MNDLRFALRQIAKAPGFTAIIVVTLALSIGACTAIYSALDRIVLNPFGEPATKQNVYLRSVKLPDRVDGGLSYPDFLDLQKRATSFELMVYHSPEDVNFSGTGEPRRLQRNLITPGYFDVYGIKMALGRTFQPDEFVLGKNNVVVLSYGLWQRTFGGTPDILGRTVQIDDEPCTVVGVISERSWRTDGINALYSPLADAPRPSNARDLRSSRRANTITPVRLRRGVSIKQAQAELDVIAAALAEKYPVTNTNFGLRTVTEIWNLRNVTPILKILFGAVGCLMLIACVNVASLLLVRANERQREMSVRAALGATRGRIIRQLLTENILVALIGGAAGVVLAQWALDFIGASVPQGRSGIIAAGGSGLARLSHLELDGGVLAFALGLTITTGLVFGLAPAWLSSSADLNEALKQGTRGSTEGRARGRFRATLVVVEIAMAVTLLACSGLLIRSFLKTAAYQTGFNPKGTALVRLILEGKNYEEPEQRFTFISSLLARIQSAAGVEAVGTTDHFPLSGIRPAAGFEIEGGPAIAITERPLAQFFSVSPDYFRAMGIPLRQGRYFSDYDGTNSRRVAIINRTFARQHFANQDPIGKRIMVADPTDRWCEIVGVVGDVAQVDVGEVPSAQLYESHAQTGKPRVVVVVRGHGDPAVLPAIVKKEVHALDPDLGVGDVNTVEGFLRDKVMPRRLMMHIITAFAVIGLFIAAIGIYGVMAFSVNQRTVEIGIRMALGAQQHDVLRLVLRQGAWLVGIGFAVGIVATFIAGRAIESQLYNTSGTDPIALVAITVFFAGVAALACWLPARRAMKVDPIVALRAE